MAQLKGSKTHNNLKYAFAGESQANRRYLYFAKIADVEGYPEVAGNFRETAEGETGHAHGHLDYLKKVGDPATDLPMGATEDNLKAAIAGETYEVTEMYPPMLRRATESGHKAKRMFGYAVEAEAVHAKLYALALEAVQQGKDLTETKFYLCPVCGHIEFGEPPAACPTCGAKAAAFVQV